MTPKPPNRHQVDDARRLQTLFYEWQTRRQAQGLPFSQAEAANILGFGQSAVSQYLKGTIPLNFRAASKFAELLGCPIGRISPSIADQAKHLTERVASASDEYAEWRQKRGLPAVGRSAAIEMAKQSLASPTSVKHPLLGWLEISGWLKASASASQFDAATWYGAPIDVSSKSFYLVVPGDSMWNPAAPLSFHQGELILVDPEVTPISGSYVVVQEIGASEPSFRQLIEEAGKRYLQALNPAWPDRITPLSDDATILGTVKSKMVFFPT